MTISKTSLLFILMMLGLQADISLNDNYGITDDSSKKIQYMLNLSRDLQKKDNADTKIAGKWLESKIVRNKIYSCDWFTLSAILTNDKLDLNEKVTYILQIKEEQEKQRTQKKLEAVLREKEDLKRNILHVATGFAVLIISVPFICAGAQIGDGFGKYIREHLWPNLDVDKRGWN